MPAGSVRIGIARDGPPPPRQDDSTVFGDRPSSGRRARAVHADAPRLRARARRPGRARSPVGTETPNVVDDGRPEAAGRVRAHLPRFWPVRKRLLGKIDRAALDGPIAEIPEAMPWEYFQAAPPDQQIEHLRGGEWLVLDGLHPAHPRVQTRLLRGACRLVLAHRDRAREPAPIPVELACDTLAVDGDAQVLTLSWRGRSAGRAAARRRSPRCGCSPRWSIRARRSTRAAPRRAGVHERGRPPIPPPQASRGEAGAAPARGGARRERRSKAAARACRRTAAIARPVAPFPLPADGASRAPAALIPGALLERGGLRRSAGCPARRSDAGAEIPEGRTSGAAALGPRRRSRCPHCPPSHRRRWLPPPAPV